MVYDIKNDVVFNNKVTITLPPAILNGRPQLRKKFKIVNAIDNMQRRFKWDVCKVLEYLVVIQDFIFSTHGS